MAPPFPHDDLPPPSEPTTAPPQRRPKPPIPTFYWVVGMVTVSVVTLIIGIGIGNSADSESQVRTIPTEDQSREPTPYQSRVLLRWEQELDDREKELDQREEELAALERTVEADSVDNGYWVVGVDMKPGTYRAQDVSSDCYWGIYTSGTNGADIISNGLPGGGNPVISVEEGQDFETSRCGVWRWQ